MEKPQIINNKEKEKLINRRIHSEKKKLNGILKRGKKKRKSSKFKPEENNSNLKLHWDNNIMNQLQTDKPHSINNDNFKDSMTKFNNNQTNENEEDTYIKGLNKVNSIKINDEIISRIIKALHEMEKLDFKRTKSCLTIGKFERNNKMKEFYFITEKEKIFDESLKDEQKLTLQNTLYNKISKNVN